MQTSSIKYFTCTYFKIFWIYENRWCVHMDACYTEKLFNFVNKYILSEYIEWFLASACHI